MQQYVMAILSPRFSSRGLLSNMMFPLRHAAVTVFGVPVGTRVSFSLDKKNRKLFECSIES